VACTVAAEATETLNVGTLVLDNDYRHPVVLAKELATLDLMSGGRFEFGFGAGWMKSDYDESGIAYDDPAVRVDRMVEALDIIEALFSGGRSTYAGAHYTVTDATLTPTPATAGGPPLVLGGGSKRVLTIAGKRAAIVSVVPSLRAGAFGAEVIAQTAPHRYDLRFEWITAGAAGRPTPPEIQIWTQFATITDDAAGTYEQLASLFSMPAEDVAASPIGMVGSVDGVIAQLEERRERWGFSYVVVHEAEIESFAPIVSALAGR